MNFNFSFKLFFELISLDNIAGIIKNNKSSKWSHGSIVDI